MSTAFSSVCLLVIGQWGAMEKKSLVLRELGDTRKLEVLSYSLSQPGFRSLSFPQNPASASLTLSESESSSMDTAF